YELILPMTIGFKDITIDCGLSRMKFQLNKDNKYDKPTYPNTYLYQISKNDWNKSWLNCYKLEKNTPNYFPLISQKSHDLSLLNQLNIQPQKIALIHIKTLAINATAKITDPKTYGPALAFLVKKGYQLVFIGREIMPEYFKQYPIVNYSESKYASFINDMKLFAMADLSITAGSGIFCLANYFNKPLLYINYWHLMTPPSGKKVINIPTTVKNKANKDLTFIEQIQLFNDLSKHGADLFPEDQYIARNASSTEILEGVKELLNLSPQLTPLQLQFQTLDKTSPKYYARSRCSEYFLKTHSHLFENA
ncbi:MAG: TIGR04372 family glycosyltransferase, partial [Simkaniaceae bacterium]|nr:TIGR04372 family glycosyltransferase [Simkaniaceae bacterium]